MKSLMLCITLLCAADASAQECLSVIALSKTVSTTVSDKETVENNARNFCNSYSSGRTSASGTNFGASYKFLSATFGKSNASAETVASKYCDASQTNNAAKDAYKQYVENISPNAYSAYAQCLAMSQADLSFNVDANSIIPKQFSMSAAFSSKVSGNQSAKVDVSASDGITCAWRNTSGSEVTLESPSSAILDCRRDSGGERGFVTLVRTDATNVKPLTLQWPAYDAQGNKLDTIARLQDRIDAIESSISTTDQFVEIIGRSLVLTDTTFLNNSASPFEAKLVTYNTLLPSRPDSSNINVPYAGYYLATTTVYVCTSGSREYISAFVNHNDKSVASSVNRANECGSAVASIVLKAKSGDIISGQCSINQKGVKGACSFSLAIIGLQRDGAR